MKAVVYTRYGGPDVLRLTDMDIPVPGDGQVLVKVLAVRLGVRHLDPLVELIRAGKITTVIDRRFTLSEVPEALRYLGEGHAKGKVVIIAG